MPTYNRYSVLIFLFKMISFIKKRLSNKTSFGNQFNLDRILIVSSTAIGDVILSTPTFTAFREENPQATIIALIKDKFCPLFLDNPDIDGVIPFRKNVSGFLRTFNDIRKGRFQAAFVLHTSDATPVILCRLANIPVVIGKSFDPRINDLYTMVVTPNPKDHAIIRRMLVAKTVYPDRTAWPSKLVLPLRPDRVEPIPRQLLMKSGLSPECDTIVGFQPGASREFKMWPKNNFIALGKKLLLQNPRIGILILGAPNEKTLGKEIEERIGDGSRAVSLCGEIRLTDLPYLTHRLNCLVTNDTGTLHIAIAVKTPTISLFVPTDVLGTGPYQDHDIHRVISKKRPCGEGCVRKKCTKTPPCMDLITVDEVFQAVVDTLNL